MAALGLFLAAAPAAFSAPTVVNGVATYSASENIGVKAIDAGWTKIVINANVTLTGRFTAYGRQTDLTIEGKDANTSIIKALPRSSDSLSDKKAGIWKDGGGKLTVKTLKIQDQPGRGIVAWGGQLTVNSCNIVQGPNDHWTDGIHASKTGDVNFTSINVYDDGTYPTMCDWVNTVKFTHRKNGAPLQIGWGQHTGGDLEKTIKDCTFTAAFTTSSSEPNYNCGTIDWKATQVNNDSIKLKMSGIIWNKTSTASTPPKFSFGNWNSSKRTVGAKIKVNGWTWNTSEIRQWGAWTNPETGVTNPGSTGSVAAY